MHCETVFDCSSSHPELYVTSALFHKTALRTPNKRVEISTQNIVLAAGLLATFGPSGQQKFRLFSSVSTHQNAH